MIAALVVGSVLLVVFIGWEMYLGIYEVRFHEPEGEGVAPRPIEGSNVVVDPDTGEIRPFRIPPRLISHTQRMLPLWIFRNHQIPVVFFSAFTGGMVMFGCLYFLAIYWSIVAGFENTKTGKLFKTSIPHVVFFFFVRSLSRLEIDHLLSTLQ